MLHSDLNDGKSDAGHIEYSLGP